MIYIFYLAKVYWSQFGVKNGLVELIVLFQRYSFFYKFNPVLTMILEPPWTGRYSETAPFIT